MGQVKPNVSPSYDEYANVGMLWTARQKIITTRDIEPSPCIYLRMSVLLL